MINACVITDEYNHAKNTEIHMQIEGHKKQKRIKWSRG